MSKATYNTAKELRQTVLNSFGKNQKLRSYSKELMICAKISAVGDVQIPVHPDNMKEVGLKVLNEKCQRMVKKLLDMMGDNK
jgi:hypothetical protein